MKTIDDLLKGFKEKNIVALSKAITLIESEKKEDVQEASKFLSKLEANSQTIKIGISGTPGVGKSTFIESIGTYLVDQGKTVAVLAIDPSSEKTGGSVLGDKTRMTNLSQKKEAFIRPSPSSGQLGGVAKKTRDTIALCEAFGFDIILLETVGVGQSEVQAATMVDIFALLVQPGGGDDLQGIKRGIMELADIIVVNKADGNLSAQANKAKQHYILAMEVLHAKNITRPDVISYSSTEPTNQDELWGMIEKRFKDLQSSGSLQVIREKQKKEWVLESFWNRLQSHIKDHKDFKKIMGDLDSTKSSQSNTLESLTKTFIK